MGSILSRLSSADMLGKSVTKKVPIAEDGDVDKEAITFRDLPTESSKIRLQIWRETFPPHTYTRTADLHEVAEWYTIERNAKLYQDMRFSDFLRLGGWKRRFRPPLKQNPFAPPVASAVNKESREETIKRYIVFAGQRDFLPTMYINLDRDVLYLRIPRMIHSDCTYWASPLSSLEDGKFGTGKLGQLEYLETHTPTSSDFLVGWEESILPHLFQFLKKLTIVMVRKDFIDCSGWLPLRTEVHEHASIVKHFQDFFDLHKDNFADPKKVPQVTLRADGVWG